MLTDHLTDHLAEHPSRDGHVSSAPEGGPLRHTCAALLIAAGAHLEEIKDHLGHASSRTTSDRFG